MSYSRRSFLKLTLKGAVIIGAGNAVQSFASGSFILPSKDKIALRFAIASDGHYGQPNTMYDPKHDELINWLNAEQKQRGVDFTMINGDLFHDDITMLPVIKQKLDKLSMPFYVSHGNHDKATETQWQQTWNMPFHYSFEQKDAAFIVLNTADETGKYICADVDYTKDELEKYKAKKQLFVFMHITPFTWTKGGLACPDITALFEKQENLKAIFHGHDHDQDAVKENNGKHYFFDSHIAGNWGTDYRGYRIVEILKSGEVLTYQMNPAINTKVNTNNL